MALQTWLIKVKAAFSSGFHPAKINARKGKIAKDSKIGVLAFEIASLMSKLLHIWQGLSEESVIHLRKESICLEGVRRTVSNDDSFLLSLACAEMTENLRIIGEAISSISKRCEDTKLRRFDRLFMEFSSTGRNFHNWTFSWKEMEIKKKRMDRFITFTATLRRVMNEISLMENCLEKFPLSCEQEQEQKITDLRNRIQWQKQEVKYLKEKSLWNQTFDSAISLLAKSIFTALTRIKFVFGTSSLGCPNSLPRSLSASATVHPSKNPDSFNFVSGPLKLTTRSDLKKQTGKFFKKSTKLLKPKGSTLGAAALALHYANLVIVIEKMIRRPQSIGIDARDYLYAMLPNSIRFALRTRLKGVVFFASDSVLATEWRDATGKILSWLSPLAHNMIKWQSERSFEQQNLVPNTNVLLLQTLYFGNKEKTEAAITELLVGLNYICRFEREMKVKGFSECANSSEELLNMQGSVK